MIPEQFTVGHATVGQDHISATGMLVDELRGLSTNYQGIDRATPSDGEIIYEDGRLTYPLIPEGQTTTATLKNVVGADNGALIILVAADPDRPITIADDQGPGDDGVTGILVCGGDFTLRSGDAFACKYNATILRWVEVGRIWASRSTDDLEYPPLSRARLHQIADLASGVRPSERHMVLLAVDTEIAI